ncbi:olfactory receptor 6N1-like [Eucyclogobius newberryi]|uniref:olfactory receptor 6N1-like n=1 Tax=Eucyclogobius newberryi TaxID=166745 RepID=UPI003B58C78E
MGNWTQVSYFILGAYSDLGPLRWLYFVLTLSSYVLIVGSNLLLIALIILNRSLHQPMYLLLCSLFVNELFGSTALFPFLLFQILQDQHTVSYTLCFLQIFCIHSYGSVEFSSLALMSYDRYLAICRPLQYQRLMTPRRISILTAVLWTLSIGSIFVVVAMSAPLKLCGNVIPKVYCINFSIVNLACSDTSVNNIYGLVYIFTVVVLLIGLIVFSYMRILRVCFHGGRQTRQKAAQTCTPHLISLASFSFGAFFEMTQSRFDMRHTPMSLRVLLSLYFLSAQPLLSPLVYGLTLGKIRDVCRGLLQRNRQNPPEELKKL